MSTQENKELVTRYLKEVWDHGNLAVAEELLAPDFVSLDVPTNTWGDRDHEMQLMRMFLAAFGNFQSTILEQVAEGDTVVTRWTATGTHLAPFQSFPATGKEIHVQGTEVTHVVNGQIRDIHAIFDMPGLISQLGGEQKPVHFALPLPPM